MRLAHLHVGTCALVLAACGPTATAPSDSDSGASDVIDASLTPSHDAPPSSAPDASAGCTSTTQPGCDCDPTGQLPAYEILVDDLSSDRGNVKAAAGFDASAWSFTDGAYQQQGTMALGRNDASLVALAEPAGDVLVHVTASSTAATTFPGDNLRQVFLTARAQSSGNAYEAAACGIDLALNGETSRHVLAAELSGSPSNVTTQARDRNSQWPQINFGEEFDIRMELRGGSMTCRISKDGEPFFVQVGGFGGSAGSVGFHTRETQALFKNLRVCGL